ncbi:hypothetical protein QTP88_028733 [Uroleucon formosanum]
MGKGSFHMLMDISIINIRKPQDDFIGVVVKKVNALLGQSQPVKTFKHPNTNFENRIVKSTNLYFSRTF